MKTLAEVLNSFVSTCLDGRDATRLSDFVPEADLGEIGVTMKPEFVGTHEHIEWTRDNVLAQLEKDVAFGFEKALDQRDLSAGTMYECVAMWNRVLDEGLADFDIYAQYGLPLFKATAVKYGWPNPIGEDTGSENKYADGWPA